MRPDSKTDSRLARRFAGGQAACAAVVVGLLAGHVQADDWPTWRCDQHRSAASAQELAKELRLQWTRDFPPTMSAWPNEPRLHFDPCYEPVVLGKTLLVGSPNDGSVTAFDTETGAERWSHFTEGPVRFAPVAWKDKVFVGSDDGYLWCLTLEDGRVLWKVRGAPEDRAQRRHLGNARLISFWPVRGGPVLVEGTIYFAAGIWPTMGVFVVAVDAQSGRLVWRNDTLAQIDKVRLDHNQMGPSGISPQGYLAVQGDTLLVPNGRSMPAGLDRCTGKLLYYVQGYRNGECRVTVHGKYAFVGQAAVLDVATGREIGSRWAAAGPDAPSGFDMKKTHLYEGPIHPYKQFTGCSAWSVLERGTAYDLVGGTFAAYNLDGARVAEYDWEWFGHKIKPWRWEVPILWNLPAAEAAKRGLSASLVKAGKRLYAHDGKRVMAVDLPQGAGGAQVRWSVACEGTPGTILAADSRLFVVTREGRLACFGPGASPQPANARGPGFQLANDRGASSQLAQTSPEAPDVLKQSGVSEGYCLVLGLGDGQLLGGLLQHSQFKVIAVDRDQAKVNRLRADLGAAGLYGARAEVFVGDPLHFPFPPYLASLMMVGDAEQAAFSPTADAPALFEVLRPYGGTLCLKLAPAQQETLRQWATAAKPQGAEVRQAGPYTLLRRNGSLAGSASWTHETSDAGRTFFSHDQLVRSPLDVLWYGDGKDHGFWKFHDYNSGIKPQVVGGRLFALQLHCSTLLAYDVFTGRLLWNVKVPRFARYVSMEDGVYVAGGGRCAILDPASGRERASFPLEPEPGVPCDVSDLRVDGDVIVVAAAREKARAFEGGLWDATDLLALDRQTGKLLWKRHAQQRFSNNAIAMGGGSVFCIDSLTPVQDEKAKVVAGGEQPLPMTLLVLDARTGAVKWSKTLTAGVRAYPLVNLLMIGSRGDWLVYSRQTKLLLAGKQTTAWAFEAETGKEVWHKTVVEAQPWVLRGDTFFDQSGAVYETRTGKPAGKGYDLGRSGCNYVVGSEHLLCMRNKSVRYIEAATRTPHDLYAIRSGCSNSLIAADGLLNVPCFSVGCICNYPIQTSFAMFPSGRTAERPKGEAAKAGGETTVNGPVSETARSQEPSGPPPARLAGERVL